MLFIRPIPVTFFSGMILPSRSKTKIEPPLSVPRIRLSAGSSGLIQIAGSSVSTADFSVTTTGPTARYRLSVAAGGGSAPTRGQEHNERNSENESSCFGFSRSCVQCHISFLLLKIEITSFIVNWMLRRMDRFKQILTRPLGHPGGGPVVDRTTRLGATTS